jgi:hypothetical protein
MSYSTSCALCLNAGLVKESHIIPAFVFRWLRDTSATGYIRPAETPNKRVQDGLKIPLLCENCEERLSVWEKRFAERVFHPWYQRPGQPIRYADWLLKFCVSISWRVLRYVHDANGLVHLTDPQKVYSRAALNRWADFLLGRAPDPASFEQHIIPWDAIDTHNFPEMSDNINRYMLRAVGTDLPHGNTTVFTHAKLAHFSVFGIIQPTPMPWEGTKVHVRDGVLGSRRYVLPIELLNYINERARHYGNLPFSQR